MNALDTSLGILASLIGSFGHTIGLTLQRKAHIQREQKYSIINNNQHQKPPHLFKDSLWLSGFITFLFSSSICPAIALAYLPVFVTAPLSAVNLAANTICAGIFLNIKISAKEYLSTLLVIFGAVWIAIFATIPEKNRSLKDLLKLYKRPVFITYFTIYEFLLVFIIVFELYLRVLYRRYRAQALRYALEEDQEPIDIFAASSPNNFRSHATNFQTFEADNRYHKLDLQGIPNQVEFGRSHDDLSINVERCNIKHKKLFSNVSKSTQTTPLINNGNHFQASAVSLLASQTPQTNTDFSSISTNFQTFKSNSSTLEAENCYSSNLSTSANFGESAFSLKKIYNRETTLNLIRDYESYSGLMSGFISGLICSQSILFTKTTIELISLTYNGENQFNNPLAWFLLFSLITTALGNLYYFNRGLRLTSTIVMIPLAFCSYTFSALVNSIIYYDQVDQLSFYQLTMAFFGFVMVFTGVGYLSSFEISRASKS
ncbi:hypothetical protein BB561_000659 [Smittium simulii]|uniref:Magnesium transporter n=1 Tax=Smittium simulii TaxID=133385 RepID=A0A2T9YY37_9FUNG|nr:hypothetical protein BB561_000659 [Smittium simulii]